MATPGTNPFSYIVFFFFIILFLFVCFIFRFELAGGCWSQPRHFFKFHFSCFYRKHTKNVGNEKTKSSRPDKSVAAAGLPFGSLLAPPGSLWGPRAAFWDHFGTAGFLFSPRQAPFRPRRGPFWVFFNNFPDYFQFSNICLDYFYFSDNFNAYFVIFLICGSILYHQTSFRVTVVVLFQFLPYFFSF